MNMEVQPNVGLILVVPSKPGIGHTRSCDKQLHRDLLVQHPKSRIDSNGNSPIVDGYDQRLAKLISDFEFTNQKHTFVNDISMADWYTNDYRKSRQKTQEHILLTLALRFRHEPFYASPRSGQPVRGNSIWP